MSACNILLFSMQWLIISLLFSCTQKETKKYNYINYKKLHLHNTCSCYLIVHTFSRSRCFFLLWCLLSRCFFLLWCLLSRCFVLWCLLSRCFVLWCLLSFFRWFSRSRCLYINLDSNSFTLSLSLGWCLSSSRCILLVITLNTLQLDMLAN